MNGTVDESKDINDRSEGPNSVKIFALSDEQYDFMENGPRTTGSGLELARKIADIIQDAEVAAVLDKSTYRDSDNQLMNRQTILAKVTALAEQQKLEAQLQLKDIAQKNYNEQFGTYDYEGIAEMVLERIKD
jgi:hypothetical protein